MQSRIQARPGAIPENLILVIDALCSVAADLSSRIALGPLGDALGASVGNNTDGDVQKALDVIADEAFLGALKGRGVRWYASEERESVVECDDRGPLAIAIDPLDGSSNIDVNVSIGTIFGISPALEDGNATFLREGTALIAAGYFIYGPQTALVVSFGNGVMQFVLDPAVRVFRQVDKQLQISPDANEYAINASNHRFWPKPIRTYIDDCIAGADGPRARNFNMRWIASLVAETHRIISRGGIFLYPSDERPGYEDGRLRLVYECAPIAFLVEQAGGRASTGTERILDRVPASLHARTPFIFGATEKVDRVVSYHDLPDHEVSALFGTRGLFRA